MQNGIDEQREDIGSSSVRNNSKKAHVKKFNKNKNKISQHNLK